MNKFEKNLFDIRTKKFHMKQGSLSDKEWEKHLKSLPDENNNCDDLIVFEEPDVEELNHLEAQAHEPPLSLPKKENTE